MKRKIALAMLFTLLLIVILVEVQRSPGRAISQDSPNSTSRSVGLVSEGGHMGSRHRVAAVTPPLHSDYHRSADGSGASDSEPTNVWEVDRRHPGFGSAYQAATLSPSFRLMYKCQQTIIQKDPSDHKPREYKFVDTYSNNGNGSMILTDSDIIPESDDDPEFFECLREGRVAARIRVATTPAMNMGDTVVVYETGRLLNYYPTPEKIEVVLKSLTEQLSEMAIDDPYRFGAEAQQRLFRCYKERGTTASARLECLRLASAQ